ASRIVVIRLADGAVRTVSDSLSSNQGAAWSPDERWVYYVSAVDGPRDIYAIGIGADGAARGRPHRLTTGLGAQTISFTPDGSRLAYSALSASANIWRLADHRPLTTGLQNIDLIHYSRDGRWILYASDISGINELYRIPADGGEAEQLTSGSTADNFAPDLSPDGKEVAFHSLRTGTRDIFVLPLDGGPVQQVTNTPAQEMVPRWSPDGRVLSFVNFSSQGGIWTVTRRADRSWGPPHEVSTTGSFADWSPDGKTIVFGASVFGTGGLSVIPAAGGPPRQLLVTGGEIQTVEFPKFTADGRTIIFKSHDPAGRVTFWSVPVAGGSPRLVARLDTEQSGGVPYWDQWQGRIAYVRFEAQSDIVVMETSR
ncbi:MAG TPA: hypothetical protein VFI13_12265, partial [Gemmatimonadales bacterium]|nr:hypothetical protein [Gemmatimonadales bacterium]